MIIPDELREELDVKFRTIYEYKEEAKEANRSASDMLAQVADLLDKEKSKASIKHFKKVARKAWKDWYDRNVGDTSTDDAQIVVASLVKDHE